jgi:hypothetical protein
MQDSIGQAGDSGQAFAVVQVAGNGGNASRTQFGKALRGVAQGVNSGAAIQQAGNPQTDIAATYDQNSHISFIERICS